MIKVLRLKDKLLSLYAEYTQVGMIQEESSEALKNVLDLSHELQSNTRQL